MAYPLRPQTNLQQGLSLPASIGNVMNKPKSMVGQQIFLPNGQTYTVTPIFGGFTFKSTDLDLHHSAMPPGWTVILQTEDEVDEMDERIRRRSKVSIHRESADDNGPVKHTIAHRFTRPTLQNDTVFISSITLPSSSDFKSPTSPTRHIALMLYTTLHWYFHKDAPSPHVLTEESQLTPEAGRPKADWRIRIKREGIFKSRNTLQKLERMGLVASEDSCVGLDTDFRSASGWQELFVSRKSFWQIDARIYLFTLAPVNHSPFPAQSPYPSRPSSPERGAGQDRGSPRPSDYIAATGSAGILSDAAGVASPGGPFASGSHLPTYYPPPPQQFTFTNHIRHPIRPKPPRQGETFYTRYIPSVEQWLSFRVPSLSSKPVPHFGPTTSASAFAANTSHHGSISVATLPTLSSFAERPTDTDLLHKWMNETRVNAAWGEAGPKQKQIRFLEEALTSRHSFPIFACWDGKPFGYFEVYWVKEDKFGRLLGGNVSSYTRGFHVLVGEQDFRGSHRVKAWLSALVHYCFISDYRTETVMLEPRVDNEKFINYLKDAGFYKQGEVAFPHKQSAVMLLDRESWEAPGI